MSNNYKNQYYRNKNKYFVLKQIFNHTEIYTNVLSEKLGGGRITKRIKFLMQYTSGNTNEIIKTVEQTYDITKYNNKKIPDIKKIPIVEVGSGNGAFAEIFKFLHPDVRYIKVDPLEEKFHKIPNEVATSDYKTVDDLIRHEPIIVNNCILIIIWPSYQYHDDDYNENEDYDMDAINKLNPISITAYWDASGGSGSIKFIEWANPSQKSPKGYVTFRSSKDVCKPPDILNRMLCLNIWFRKE